MFGRTPKSSEWANCAVYVVYALPVAYSVTKASVPDINAGHDMVKELEKERLYTQSEKIVTSQKTQMVKEL